VFNLKKVHYFCLLSAITLSAQAEIQLSGEIKQGGLVIGKTQPNNIVRLNERVLPVSSNGDYVFAFSRDDDSQYLLTVTSPEGTIEQKKLIPTKRDYKISHVEGIKKSIMTPNKKAKTRAKVDWEMINKVRKVSSNLTDFSQGFICSAQGSYYRRLW